MTRSLRKAPAILAVGLCSLQGSRLAADDLAVRAAALHREAIVVDTHQDVPWKLLKKWVDFATPAATPHVDIPRLVAGGVTAPFFSVASGSAT